MNSNEYAGMNAFEILNYYRNCHYMDDSNTESGILANAINEILPEYSRLKIADSDIICPDAKECLYCVSSKIADGSDRILTCYNHPARIGKRTLVEPEYSCPNFIEDKNL